MFDVTKTDTRPFFMDIWRAHRFDTKELSRLAVVPESATLAMLRHQSVKKSYAVRVLAVLSIMSGQNINLDTVRVSLSSSSDDRKTVSVPSALPDTRLTFRQIQQKHGIELAALFGRAHVSLTAALKMARNEPVQREIAVGVLATLCDMIGASRQTYTLDTLNINIK